MYRESFAVLENEIEAQNLINEINQVLGFSANGTLTYTEPLKHPVEEWCIVSIDDRQLKRCGHLLENIEIISRSEVKRRGWYLGFFEGTFAREKQKMEDIHFLFDAIIHLYGQPNFPALRALIMSFLSACFALKEGIGKKIMKKPQLNEKLDDWWKERSKELKKKDELLHSFELFMNTEKHGGDIVGQHSSIELVPSALMSSYRLTSHPLEADPNTLHISAEGAFMFANQGSPMERRLPVGIQDAKYEVLVRNPPKYHLGHSIEGASLLQMLAMIRQYYAHLLFDAERELGEGNPEKISVQFMDQDSMHISEK